MASIQRSGSKYRVQVYVKGRRDSETFRTRQEAATWALQREAELGGRRLPDRTWGDALERYGREVAPGRKGARWELVRVKSWRRHPLARRQLSGLTGADLALWRDERLKRCAPATVARELNLMRAVLEIARRDWQWVKANPLADVKWPAKPKGRARRIQPNEVQAVARAFGVNEELRAETQTQRVGLAFLLALETAMRSGEMLRLHWRDVKLAARYVVLTDSKNGDRREVPLTTRAVEILRALPEGDGPIFDLTDDLRDALWRKYRPSSIHDLHFHDTRGEAIWRLSKKLDVLQLARMIGHRDPKSLMIYYRETAEEMARLLD